MSAADPSPRRTQLLTVLVLAATFLTGAVTGAGALRWMSPPPPPPPMPLPLHELQLSKEQSAQVHAIMERHRGDLEAILKEAFPRVRAINDEIEREVRAVLSPEQQSRLDTWKSRRPPPPPPPGRDGAPPPPPPPPFGPPGPPPPQAP